MSSTHFDENKFIPSTSKQKRLLSDENAHLQRDLESFVTRFCERKTVFFENERVDLPVYGLSSEMAARTPIRLYDHPALMEMCNTAFTDGARVFISAALFKDLWPEQQAGKRAIDFVVVHELEHIRLHHVKRLQNIDHSIANIAADIRINIDAYETFAASRAFFGARRRDEYKAKLERIDDLYREELDKYACSMTKSFCGLKPEDRAKWGTMSSEQIALALMAEAANKPKVQLSDLLSQVAQDMRDMANGMKGQPQQGQPGQPGQQGQSGQPGQPGQQGQPGQSGQPGQPGQQGQPGQPGQQGQSGQPGQPGQSGQPGQPGQQGQSGPSGQQGQPGQSGQAGAGGGGLSADALNDLADALDRAANGKATKSDLEKIAKEAGSMAGSEPMRKADMNHAAPSGTPQRASDIPPSIRSQMAADAAQQELDPKKGKGNGMSGGKGKPKGDAGDPGNFSSPSQRHYIAPEDLNASLERADANALSKALGYDTPESIAKMNKDAASNAENAVRSAADDVKKQRGSYPGAHRVESAMRDLQDFSKPVLDWKLKIKKVLSQAAGKRKTTYSLNDPWMPYSTPARDMGFSSSDDVPYMGSHVPIKPKKNLVLGLIDTSGSTSDILHRLTSEALGLVRKNQRENSPDVLLCFADTIVRGKPVLVTERTVSKLLQTGVNAGGGGGTDFLAPLVSAVKATEKGGVLQGRKIDQVIYFTDGECWLPPRDKLPEEMPPVLFVVPKERYNAGFDNAVKDSDWAEAVFFSEDELKPKVVDVSRPKMRM